MTITRTTHGRPVLNSGENGTTIRMEPRSRAESAPVRSSPDDSRDGAVETFKGTLGELCQDVAVGRAVVVCLDA